MSTPPQLRQLRFVATPRLRRLALVAGLAVSAAVASGRGELLVVAVGPLVLLATAASPRLPAGLEVAAAMDQDRCVEGDEVVLTVTIRGAGFDSVVADPVPPAWATTFAASRTAAGRRVATGSFEARWTLRPGRWGRHRVGPVHLTVRAADGSYLARTQVEVGDLVVYPAAAALARAVAPPELAAPLGEHPSRAVGSGVEFAGVRPYAAGDRQRDVDWRTSARHGQLFVRQYAAERAFDLVLCLDTAVDAGEPGRSTLDLTVRAATGLAQSYLRAHDRVGLVTFGGPLHWLRPAAGPRQLFQVFEAVLAMRPDEAARDAGAVRYGLEQLPRAFLPRRAFVALVSPLLDNGPVDAVLRMRERGFTPLVIDVLTTEPTDVPPSRAADLAVRTWRLQRAALKADLAALGVPVLDWDGAAELTGGLLHAMRASRR